MKAFALALSILSCSDAFTLNNSPNRGVKPLKQGFLDGSNMNTNTNAGNVYPIASPEIGGLAKAEPEEEETKKTTHEIFENLTPVKVQGNSLKTCSFDESVDRVSIYLKTEGRPLNANVELWQGPDNAPQKVGVYLEDGHIRPFRAVFESPGGSNSVAIRNTGQMEFPLAAGLECEMTGIENAPSKIFFSQNDFRTVQGGAVYTTPFPPAVVSVQVALKTDGRPLNARVELLQGPNNNKQVMDIYTEDGQQRPLYAVIDTPGSGNVVRIVNTATVEFPLVAAVDAFMTDNSIVETTTTPGGMRWS